MALAALGAADMFKRRARLCGRLGLTPLPKLGANGLVGFEVSGRDKRDFRGYGLAGRRTDTRRAVCERASKC